MAEQIQQNVKIVKEAHYPTSKWLERSDGIIQINAADNVFFTLKDAKIFVEVMKDFTGGMPRLLLIIPGRHMSVDKEVRSYMASEEALQHVIAQAILVSSFPQQLFNNLYLSVDKPVKPTKFFENTNEAIEWLKKQHT